jgi:benzil reductase ((S)-benzoin forming)
MTETLIWISGASAGIGRALVDTQPYDARVIDISRSGGTPGTEHLRADLSDPGSWRAVETHFATELQGFEGRRAVFVHNAGTLHPMGFAGEVDSDAYRANVLLNSAAPQVLGHGFLRAARDFDGEGHLLMLTSGAASRPYEGWSSYSAGKAAVEMWVRTAGAEQHRRGGRVRIVAVAPGVVATGMQEQIRNMDERDFPAVDKFRGLHERGELRDPAEAARGIWSLLDRDLDNGSVVDLRSLS